MSLSLLPIGKLIYHGKRGLAIALHVSTTMTQTVERPRPKRSKSVRYSTLVASFHIVTATCFSVEWAFLIESPVFQYEVSAPGRER